MNQNKLIETTGWASTALYQFTAGRSSPSSDILISTLEFNNETAGVIRLAQSFNDVTATTELAEMVTFIESAWDVSLPNKNATGQR